MPFLEFTVESMSSPQQRLIRLGRRIGDPLMGWTLTGEGVVSARLSERLFVINATGSSLDALKISDLVECKTESFAAAIDQMEKKADAPGRALELFRFDKTQKEPPFETVLHSYLCSLPETRFVAHAHPPSIGAFLCSGRGAELAGSRLFPDEIFWCGESSILIPYQDLGGQMARAVKEKIEIFREDHEELPRVILIENFGILTFGKTPDSVFMAMSMCEKVAHIRTVASHLGKTNALRRTSVKRISALAKERRVALRM